MGVLMKLNGVVGLCAGFYDEVELDQANVEA